MVRAFLNVALLVSIRFRMRGLFAGVSAAVLFGLLACAQATGAETAETSPEKDETMIMFVGEDLEVLSIASRREESARQAPAVAQVIARKEIEERGIRTLSQALEMKPGFHMARREWGTQPYLRGIPDSVLFLYDTVPLISETSKSVHPLDYDLSLAAVKRIEIIRGPGSVLWGPDAFGGIVNVVPMTGKDLDGTETGILYGGGDGEEYGAYANLGHDAGPWDAFLSVSGRRREGKDRAAKLVRFWEKEDVPAEPEVRFGEEHPEESRYFEASGRFAYQDWFALSARVCDNRSPYILSSRAEDLESSDRDLSWLESRSEPMGFIKVEASKDLERNSALRFTGFYSWLRSEIEVVDRTLTQNERAAYGELIYDRSFLAGSGLLTGGLSYRRKRIEDAPIWDSFVPDFFGEENEFFLPLLREEDHQTKLWSLFGQYSHKVGNMDFWIGLRYDNHDAYQDHVSYNAGVSWSPSREWILKLLYGTAYRTPFARQLLEENEPEMEKIRSLSAQVMWEPSERGSLSLVGFASRIDNHRIEDPFAGLSSENRQDFWGAEVEGRLLPWPDLELAANLTLVYNSGPDETFRVLDRYEEFVPVFVDLSHPYERGPGTLFNLIALWKPHERFSTSLRVGYVSSRDLIHPKEGKIGSASGRWIADLSATVRDVFWEDLDLILSVRNLTDNDYETPGTYSMIGGDPFSVVMTLRKRW